MSQCNLFMLTGCAMIVMPQSTTLDKRLRSSVLADGDRPSEYVFDELVPLVVGMEQNVKHDVEAAEHQNRCCACHRYPHARDDGAQHYELQQQPDPIPPSQPCRDMY
eukprot:1641788-Rhodomonas_salina.6